MSKLIGCEICGLEFTPKINKHYISRSGGKTGVVSLFQSNDEEKLYDTFDCPRCGCQCIAQERKRVYIPSIEIDEENKEENEEENKEENKEKCYECDYEDEEVINTPKKRKVPKKEVDELNF